jgi:ubiquinone biosynthesis protein COQ9
MNNAAAGAEDREAASDLRARLLDAMVPHVVFDGWSDTALRAACADADIGLDAAQRICPRGAIDLAVAYHEAGDQAMLQRLREADTAGLRLRDKVALAVRTRLDVIPEREAVRRSSALFALPQFSAEGAKLIWKTADLIWHALGDRSEDLNWYTKRATLAGVLGASVLYWLGDESPEQAETWAFVDRQIDAVMRVEQMKTTLRRNPATRRLMEVQDWFASKVRAPMRLDDLPGRWQP